MLVLWGVIELNIGVSNVIDVNVVREADFESQIILTCIPTLGPLIPYFRNATTDHSHSRKNTYQLSSLERNKNLNKSANGNSSVTTAGGGIATTFDKYGDFGKDFLSTSNKNLVSDSSSEEDRVRLKDATMAENTAYGVMDGGAAAPPIGGGNIVKTTDIRVSDEFDHHERAGADPGAVTRLW